MMRELAMGWPGAVRQLRLPLLTSEAVLTELFHLVGLARAEMEAAWKFVRSGAPVLGAIEVRELGNARACVTLLGPFNGFRGCDASLSGEARIAFGDSYRGSCGLRDVPD
jgi:hypothetical protein